jgi:hypothetical protein
MEKDTRNVSLGERRPSLRSAIALLVMLVSCANLLAIPESPTPSGSTAPGVIALGTPIRFNLGGGSERYRGTGWSKTEQDFTWTEGKLAKLNLSIPADTGALVLTMNMGGLTKPPTLAAQAVEVVVNGQKVADWQVADPADFTAQLPADLTKKGGALTIELRLPNATSPKALGLGDDGRLLGIRAHSLELKRP